MRAKWWTEQDDRVVCELCPRNCRLNEGDRGFCFIRTRRDNQLVLDLSLIHI